MEGDFVDEGKLLVRIRPDNFINALERAKANYNQVRANLSSSKSNLSRSEEVLLKAITVAPASASAIEQALPNPLPAPVTKAYLFFRFIF